MRTYLVYCEFVLRICIVSHSWGESNLRQYRKHLHLMKTDKNIVAKRLFGNRR